MATYRINVNSMTLGQTVVINMPALPNGAIYSVMANGSSVLWQDGETPKFSDVGKNLIIISYVGDFFASYSQGHA